MKKHLKESLKVLLFSCFITQSGGTSLLEMEDNSKTLSSLRVSDSDDERVECIEQFSSFPTIDEKDRYEPKDENNLTIEDVVSLIHNGSFFYDKSGKYFETLQGTLKSVKEEGKCEFSKDCMVFVCEELGYHYASEGEKDKSEAMLELSKNYRNCFLDY
ncbi:hypothetical protein UFOVP1597_8 [uncultured Caudovirales phage]|jgi:hypothetical protein|uniref:Uncharacterized protein n=1 Tax=uncultured Caudovirales phage TaxID=2100421 RepID=A0A6J5SS62_9CAUD|nr:hypothetical protein UFOVP1597_8 [uncultured Caudovirales phage]